MGLKKAFFLLAVMCLLGSLLLTAAVWAGCSALRSAFPAGGIAFGPDGMITYLEEPTGEQRAVSAALGYIQIFSCILFPVCGPCRCGGLVLPPEMQGADYDITGRCAAHQEAGFGFCHSGGVGR